MWLTGLKQRPDLLQLAENLKSAELTVKYRKNQLYPLLIAPLFGHGDVPFAITAAHVLNAIVMASAALPAYALARNLPSGAGPEGGSQRMPPSPFPSTDPMRLPG